MITIKRMIGNLSNSQFTVKKPIYFLVHPVLTLKGLRSRTSDFLSERGEKLREAHGSGVAVKCKMSRYFFNDGFFCPLV